MSRLNATLHISKNSEISAIDNRLYSSFIEHMGRAVYTGIYEPGHPTADEHGFRQDVMELIRPLNLSHIRYPGGNFLSGYRWEDGIGPRENRPVRPELAWFALEPNSVGTDEFLQYCERLGVSAMLGVNLGTGTPQDAANLLEYVNGSLPTHYAELRRKNGHAEPYGVKLWCLGNEMDGPWQICAKTAEEYGRIACETAKMMKWLDPDIELVACGSSYRNMPTFGQWERTVLKHCYPYINYLSLHQYYQNNDGDLLSFLANSVAMDGFIKEVAAICREAKREQGGDHDVHLSFDEWNVWYHFQKECVAPPKWMVARPIEEERYNMADALVVGCMMNTLINNADTVKIACLAQLVNTIAPIMTEQGGRAWAQTIYHPFLYASRYGRGTAFRANVDAPEYACSVGAHIPMLDCATVLAEDGSLTLFTVNRSLDEAIPCHVTTEGFPAFSNCTAISMCGHAPTDCNTADAAPVFPRPLDAKPLTDGSFELVLPPFSWNMLRLIP
ncbi:MAG TPA: alpha-N-arabinofuranosidase [Clostridia bacterium]|nr:alpha-N-arabinofuranosidase [Clostridia bacterium]